MIEEFENGLNSNIIDIDYLLIFITSIVLFLLIPLILLIIFFICV